jgi:hypothetical protein
MSLRDLSPGTRRRLHFHGWVLTAWCVLVGSTASWILLHGLGLRAPAARYAASAVVMYSVGLVLGARVWLAHFAATVREEPATLGLADAPARAAFDADQRSTAAASQGLRKSPRSKWNWGSNLFDIADLFSLDELAVFLIVPALIVAALAGLTMLGAAPLWLADGMAALLAEIAVQFVFGALLVRGVMRPKPHDDAFLHIVGQTWIVGMLLVLASAVAGGLLMLAAPGAASIGELFRR